MIKSEDISVVVQGAIDREDTKKCLKSIRKYLPKAEIILSTWKDSDVEGLDYDILVENDDPGAVMFNFESRRVNNVNRQLISTKNGLEKVSRKYTLKFRTDFYLKGTRFLNFFDKFPKRDEKYSVFKHRVVASSMYTRDYSTFGRKRKFLPFHPSDFYFFGLSEDVISYFKNTPTMKEEDMAKYPCKAVDKKPYQTPTFRYTPEQYFCLNFVWQHFPDVKFEDWTDWNKENVSFSKNFLLSNFIFLSTCESQIDSEKHWRNLMWEKELCRGIIFYQKFVKIYKRMFDKNYNPREYLLFGYFYDKLKIFLLRSLLKKRAFYIKLYKIFYYNFC